jgi:hypothetical protein
MSIYEYSESLNFGWDAWAQSGDLLNGDGYFEYSVDQSIGVICGISPDGISEHYSHIRHGFYVEGSYYRVIESGIVVGTRVAFSPTARFRVRKTGLSVQYYVDEVEVYSSIATYTSPSRLYAALYGYYDNVVNAEVVEESSEATLAASLPRLVSEAFADHYASSESILPSIQAIAWSDDTTFAESELPNIVGMAATDDVAFCLSALPRYSAFAEQGELAPDVVQSMSYLPALDGVGFAEDPPSIESDLATFLSFGFCVDEDDAEIDGGLGLGILPSYVGLADVQEESWLTIDLGVPIKFTSFRLAPMLSGRVFELKGMLEGTSLSAEIIGKLTTLRGEMLAGAQMEAEAFSLQGNLEGSVTSLGQIEGKLFSLHGGAISGAQMDASAFRLRGRLEGSLAAIGALSGRLFEVKGTVTGGSEIYGRIDGAAFALKGSMVGDRVVSGDISGRLFSLFGHIHAEKSAVGVLDGRFTKVRGLMTGGPMATGEIEGEIFKLNGTMIGVTDTFSNIIMRYTRF